MPIHDWTRVDAGLLHDFHQTWVIEVKKALNAGLLPSGYYALAEQVMGGGIPDVVSLDRPATDDPLPSLAAAWNGRRSPRPPVSPPVPKLRNTPGGRAESSSVISAGIASWPWWKSFRPATSTTAVSFAASSVNP
jgi:hypothetical protein